MAMLVFKLILLPLIGISATDTDLTLSTGAYIRFNGKLHLVDKYLGLLLDFTHLSQFNDQFISLKDQLVQIKNAIDYTSCSAISPELNSNIILDLTDELNNVIAHKQTRRKRAWPALVIGGISALFSLSSQVQLIYLQNQMSDVTEKQENIRIEQIQTKERLEETQTLVNLLQSDVNSLKIVLNNMTNNMELCFQFTQITSVLINIKLDLERTIRELRSYINSIIAVSNGHVTADILPIESLNRILYNDTYDYKTNTIFPKHKSHLYYPFLEAQLTPKGLLITVPLHSARTYNYFTFTPYPTCADNETLILDSKETELLIDVQTHSHFEENLDTLKKCTTHFKLTLCNTLYLNIVENTKDTCLYSLLNSAESSPSCRFISLTSRDSLPTFLRIDDFTLVHNPSKELMKIICPGNITDDASCNIFIPIVCGIRSNTKTLNPIPIVKVNSTTPKIRKVTIPAHQIVSNDNKDYETFWIFSSFAVFTVLINGLIVFAVCRKLKGKVSLPKIIHKVSN